MRIKSARQAFTRPSGSMLGVLFVGWLTGSFIVTGVVGQDQDKEKKPPRGKITRAARPQFSVRDRADFFDNAFEMALKGERPAVFSVAAKPADVNSETGDATSNSATSYAWSNVIGADSLEQEIKRLNGVISSVVTTPRKFESGGYRDARLHFSMLAMLFAIISEYDQDIKWHDDAHIARHLFGTMAANAKAGSREVYQQAKLRRDDLRELVSGGNVSAQGEIEKATDWATLVDRVPLMERIDIGYADRLKPFVSNASEFNSNADELRIEAEMFAAVAEVLTREGMPEADDDGYIDYAHQMRDSAKSILTAIESKNYDLAAEAVSRIDQACQNCHIDYQ